MTLPPLRWRLDHDAIVTPEGAIHRPECPAPTTGETLPAGAIIELDIAPKPCDRCIARYELLLGHEGVAFVKPAA
jgi:hypothetical protein